MFKESIRLLEEDYIKSSVKFKKKYSGKTLEELMLLKIRAESREKQFASLPLMIGVAFVIVTSSVNEIIKRSIEQWLKTNDTASFLKIVVSECVVFMLGIVIVYSLLGLFTFHLSNKKLLLESMISEMKKQGERKEEIVEIREKRLQRIQKNK